MGILKKAIGALKMAKKKWNEYTYKQKVQSYNNRVNNLKRAGMSVTDILGDVYNVDGFTPNASGRITEKMGYDSKKIEAAIANLPTVGEYKKDVAAKAEAERQRLNREAAEWARVQRLKREVDEMADEIFEWYNSPDGALMSATSKDVHSLMVNLGSQLRNNNDPFELKNLFEYGMKELGIRRGEEQ